MATEITTIEREFNGINYEIEVEVYAKIVDESFDHAFGTESAWGIELTDIEIITVYNEEGDVITSRKIIQQLENMLDIDDKDFQDVEFDFSE